jgi:hypothetical protein
MLASSSSATSRPFWSAATWTSGAGMAISPVLWYSIQTVCLTGKPGLTAPGTTRLVCSRAWPAAVTVKALGRVTVLAPLMTRTE